MKKKIGASILCVLLLCMAYGVEWELIRDSDVYIDATGLSQYSFLETLKAGTIIEGIKTNVYFYESPYDFLVAFNDEKHHTDAEAVKPKGTKHLMDETLLTPALSRSGKTWFNAHSVPILQSKNRETARQFEEKTLKSVDNYSEGYWYDDAYMGETMDLFQVVINMRGIQTEAKFYITDIKKIRKHYELITVCAEWYNPDSTIPIEQQATEGKKSTLLVYPDGEYLDIYVGTTDNHLWSFVAVDEEYQRQFWALIRPGAWYPDTSCDLTNVIFPRRADKNHRIGTTCIVAESLRLRKEESTSSATLHTMKAGTKLKILQLGKQQTIDGITANWVQVEVLDASLEEPLSNSASTSVPKGDVRRTTGWCFGGYLLEQ